MRSIAPPAYESLDAAVEAQMERWTVPGVAVGILRDGQQELHGYGVASIETQQPAMPETLFQIGSISKVFTATLVMRLVSEGKLALDTPVVEYLPDLKLTEAGTQHRVTLRHLLSHTSGIYGDYFEDFGWGDEALAKAVATYDTLAQLYEPDEMWAYTNSGFNLAARVVEVVLDKPFETAMGELIFKPLRLERTFYFAHEAIAYSAAVGHTQVEPGADEIEVARRYPLPRVVAGAGGVISTVGDLLTFAQFHLGDGTADGERVLSEASLKEMQAVQTHSGLYADDWGLGWDIHQVGGAKVIGHGGSTNGFMARLTIVPERRWAIALLTNGQRGTTLNNRVRDWALDHELGLRNPSPQPIKLSDEQLAAFAGTWENPLGRSTITVDDGGLKVVPVGKSPLTGEEKEYPAKRWEPIGEREFMVAGDEDAGSLVFFLPPKGDRPARLHSGRLSDKTG